jgi:hypothetical protein
MSRRVYECTSVCTSVMGVRVRDHLAAIRQELAVLKWMVATTVTLQIMTLAGLLGLLWKVFPR